MRTLVTEVMTVAEFKKIISQPEISDETIIFVENEKGMKASTIIYDQDRDKPGEKNKTEKIIVIGSRI